MQRSKRQSGAPETTIEFDEIEPVFKMFGEFSYMVFDCNSDILLGSIIKNSENFIDKSLDIYQIFLKNQSDGSKKITLNSTLGEVFKDLLPPSNKFVPTSILKTVPSKI
ncbi:MAG: hypothetical protein ACJATU_000563 [Rickettsiales bacterium]|jgi:hypothetical protein